MSAFEDSHELYWTVHKELEELVPKQNRDKVATKVALMIVKAQMEPTKVGDRITFRGVGAHFHLQDVKLELEKRLL